MNKEILQEANKLIKNELINQTNINSVKLFKTIDYSKRQPLTYEFCLILVLQGKKLGYLPNKSFEYNKDNYLVVPISLPFECETYASKEEPFICLAIDIDKKMMFDIISSLSNQEAKNCKTIQMGVFQDSVTPQIEDIVLRLLKTLKSKEESAILGESILKELYYRIATNSNSHFLHKMFLKQKQEAKISKSLKSIHDNFNQPLDIPTLAKQEDMSVSSFHTHFKNITSYSPLQYIKKIRLNKAKDFIEQKNMQVNNTAYAVGYESVSQFSKDFKKYFGYPPKEAKIAL
ncbi:AraC family transcriptional regulator [Arcobacter roscoffensis]|uniref:AraC family transcriptional regulator n=1 Tax=Arcobacter roscoffensis TaxID=2961520 RepID=A0ABY5E2X0_9BACT|nr:AraC family transcriptional regulator [Arcobacter roscoffensis]UTJ05105.1 AraC family transcriptional regulator [Arcobacter roscoffensis]